MPERIKWTCPGCSTKYAVTSTAGLTVCPKCRPTEFTEGARTEINPVSTTGRKRPGNYEFLIGFSVTSVLFIAAVIAASRNPSWLPRLHGVKEDASKSMTSADEQAVAPAKPESVAATIPPPESPEAQAVVPAKPESPASNLPQSELPPDKLVVHAQLAANDTQVPAPRSPDLLPVPSVGDQAKAKSLIKEVFKSEYADAIQPGEKAVLAKNLLSHGIETTDDPVGRFVLLQEARDLAIEIGDVKTILESIDRLKRSFKIASLEMQTNALLRAARVSRPVGPFAAHTASIVALLDEAIAVDNYDVAHRLGDLVHTIAKNSNDAQFLMRATLRIREIEFLEKANQNVMKDRETLKVTPDDPDSNLRVGKYLCFLKGEWSEGTAMLALGSDEAIRSVALLELEPTADPLKVADAWWNISEQLDGIAKSRTQSHAAGWYQKALPRLSGLTKAKAQHRLNEVVMPQAVGSVPEHAVTKGSFSAWTEPRNPEPGQLYEILIQVRLPENVKSYRGSDLSGSIAGTDQYQQPIKYTRNETFPVEDGSVRIRIPVPGGARLVRDTIRIESKILREKQVLEIEFK